MSRRSRISEARKLGLKHQGSFEKVLDYIGDLRLDKCRQYGERRYENPDIEFNRAMAYSDVYRKFIRLEQQMKIRAPLQDLFETYRDLAAYSAMALQLINTGKFGGLDD